MSKLKTKKEDHNLFSRIYTLVKKIPEGKVMTYGQVASILGTRDARKIGWALHANKDPNIPCHRVVNKEGKVAENYAFDGWREQKRKLEEEGGGVTDDMHVDLPRFLYDRKSF